MRFCSPTTLLVTSGTRATVTVDSFIGLTFTAGSGRSWAAPPSFPGPFFLSWDLERILVVLATLDSSDPPCGPRDSFRFPAGQSRRECPFPEQLKHRPSLEPGTVCVNRHRSAYWHPLSVSQLMHAVLWTTLAALIGSCCIFLFSLWSALWCITRWIRSTHGLHPYHIVGFSRWALCCRRQPVCSLSSPNLANVSLLFATTLAKTRGSGKTNWSSSARTTHLLHFRMELTISAALLDGPFQSTNICSREVLSTCPPGWKMVYSLNMTWPADICRFAAMSS